MHCHAELELPDYARLIKGLSLKKRKSHLSVMSQILPNPKKIREPLCVAYVLTRTKKAMMMMMIYTTPSFSVTARP